MAVFMIAMIRLSFSVRQEVYMNSNRMAKPSGSTFGSRLIALRLHLWESVKIV